MRSFKLAARSGPRHGSKGCLVKLKQEHSEGSLVWSSTPKIKVISGRTQAGGLTVWTGFTERWGSPGWLQTFMCKVGRGLQSSTFPLSLPWSGLLSAVLTARGNPRLCEQRLIGSGLSPGAGRRTAQWWVGGRGTRSPNRQATLWPTGGGGAAIRFPRSSSLASVSCFRPSSRGWNLLSSPSLFPDHLQLSLDNYREQRHTSL
jgi:hypothetical protein